MRFIAEFAFSRRYWNMSRTNTALTLQCGSKRWRRSNHHGACGASSLTKLLRLVKGQKINPIFFSFGDDRPHKMINSYRVPEQSPKSLWGLLASYWLPRNPTWIDHFVGPVITKGQKVNEDWTCWRFTTPNNFVSAVNRPHKLLRRWLYHLQVLG